MTTSTVCRSALIKHRILFGAVLVLGLALGLFELSQANYFEATVMSLAVLLAVLELKKSMLHGQQMDPAKNSEEHVNV